MLNKELYLQLEREFEHCHMEEEVEDVLLELAEILADKGVMGKEVCHQEKYGRTLVEACAVCSPDEEEPEEVNVLVRWIKIGKKEFEINDYLL